MPELFFRLERGQLTRMRTLALVFLLLTAGGALAIGLAGWRWQILPLPAFLGVGFGWNYLAQRNAYTRIDTTGIDARILAGLRRRAAWAEIEDIQVRVQGSGNTSGLVVLRAGTRFAMGAPMTSLLFADPGFEAKFGQIVKAWRAQRR